MERCFLFSPFVKLRDHPRMSCRGTHNWPPVWTCAKKNGGKTATGEIGVLTYVYANTRVSDKCYLVIEHNKENYIGCLTFDDRPFCAQISLLLRSQIGRTIQAIGDLDLS
jgi:hypothetical protein